MQSSALRFTVWNAIALLWMLVALQLNSFLDFIIPCFDYAEASQYARETIALYLMQLAGAAGGIGLPLARMRVKDWWARAQCAVTLLVAATGALIYFSRRDPPPLTALELAAVFILGLLLLAIFYWRRPRNAALPAASRERASAT